MSQIGITMVDIDRIVASPTNPRKRFDDLKLHELAESISSTEGGIQVPVIVVDRGEHYELVAGERRWRAGRIAGLTEIPAIVRNLTANQILEIQVIENSQRDDVHPVEEGIAFKAIVDSGIYGAGVEAIRTLASKIAKSQSHVYERIQLSKLIDEAKEDFLSGFISMGHAVEIARLTPAWQTEAITLLLWETSYVGQGKPRERMMKITPTQLGVRVLKEWIERNIHHPLLRAPFDISNGFLLAVAGPCTACPKRTAAHEINPSDKPDRCLDPACYAEKVDAHIEYRVGVLVDDGERVLYVTSDYCSGGERNGAMVYGRWSYTNDSSGDAVGINVETAEEIRIYLNSERQTGGTDDKANRERQAILYQRKIDIGRTYRERLRDAILPAVPKEITPSSLRSLVTTRVLDGSNQPEICKLLGLSTGYIDRAAASKVLEKAIPNLTEEKIIQIFFIASVAEDLVTEGASSWSFEDHKLPKAEALARSLGIDPKIILDDVRQEFPKPPDPSKAQTSVKKKKGAADVH